MDKLRKQIKSQEKKVKKFEKQIEALKNECAAGAETAGLKLLHADHLGRPQFASDQSGAIVWDMGAGVTPFGDGINLASAFAQNLMFPGQYADEETGLSHNWHRTYDPTLGRYLQSDPIGLAGGLNRYAYVGGNPLAMIDPKGLDGYLVVYAKDGNGKFGHAFVSYCPSEENSDNETCQTYAFWPENEREGTTNRLNTDYKKDVAGMNGNEYTSRRIWLNDRQERDFFQRIEYAKKSRYAPIPIGYTCAEFASGIWNRYSPSRLDGYLPSHLEKQLTVRRHIICLRFWPRPTLALEF